MSIVRIILLRFFSRASLSAVNNSSDKARMNHERSSIHAIVDK